MAQIAISPEIQKCQQIDGYQSTVNKNNGQIVTHVEALRKVCSDDDDVQGRVVARKSNR